MDWSRDGADWPNHGASRFVESRPHRWHVQVAGTGPAILLIHGTGAATHSWRDILPLLARTHRVIAPDLPGHGFTRLGSRRRSSLPAMAEDLWTLCDTLGERPTVLAGHSAGAAIALTMERMRPGAERIVGLNAALGSFDGPAAWLFPSMARALAAMPLVPIAVSGLLAATGGSDQILHSTGSRIDATGRRLYRRLVQAPSHVEGALEMMAQWSTRSVGDALPGIAAPVRLLTGERDKAVPPGVSHEAAARLPDGRVVSLGALGHLAHEEAPEAAADLIRADAD